jgi:hypothetical protein
MTANANWDNPTLDSSPANFVTETKNRDLDVAIQFSSAADGDTIPTNAIKWNATLQRWQLYGGSSFGELTTNYKLTSVEVTGTTKPTNGLYLPSANSPSITSNDNIALQFNASGAFGVGASPSFGTSGQVLTSGGTGSSPSWTTISAGGIFTDYVTFSDRKDEGTDGGTFTNGAWRDRTITNQTSYPQTVGFVVFTSGTVFQLDAGTYVCRWSCPAWDVARHQSRLYDDTNSAAIAYGSNSYSHPTYPDMTRSIGVARFTVSSDNTNFKIQHRCQTTKSTTGFGIDNNFDALGLGDTEIYTIVEIYKEST